MLAGEMVHHRPPIGCAIGTGFFVHASKHRHSSGAVRAALCVVTCPCTSPRRCGDCTSPCGLPCPRSSASPHGAPHTSPAPGCALMTGLVLRSPAAAGTAPAPPGAELKAAPHRGRVRSVGLPALQQNVAIGTRWCFGQGRWVAPLYRPTVGYK
jgi:hypothetical protein